MAHGGVQANDRNTVTHKRLIEKWIAANPQFQTHGFRDVAFATIQAADDEGELYWESEFCDGVLYPAGETELAKSLRECLKGLIPDAYWVDVPNRTLVLYEAVNGHKISEQKRQRLVSLFECLDYLKWDFIIFAQWADGFKASVTGAEMLYADIEHGDELRAA